MADWSSGYVTDVTYIPGYYQELSPAIIRFCLLIQQLTPPPAEDFNYCELGFGQGLSLNLHAAASPGAFAGTDFNSEQAAFAARLAGAAGSDLAVCDDSFEDFSRRDLPQFDYIALHGIWSWINDANRRQIVEFANKRLKRGGAFYVSYNCYPGLAAIEPMRKLFMLHDRRLGEGVSSLERIQGALEFTERIFQAGPHYFHSSGNVGARFEALKNASPRYLAHEYFNANWDIMYFSDVAEMLAGARLNFAASAVPHESVKGLGMSDEAREYLNKVADPFLYQQLYDYFVNRAFRKDIYVRGASPLDAAAHRERMLAQRFILTREPAGIDMTLKVGMGTASFLEEIYRPAVAALAEDGHSPKGLDELRERLGGKLDYSQLLSVCINLMGVGVVLPCQTPEAAERCRATARALNAAICRLAGTRDDLRCLASPVTGVGVAVSRMDQLALDAASSGSEVAPYLLRTLQAGNIAIMKNGRNAENEAEARHFLEEFLADFHQKREPILKSLGIA
jgi:hypothetical protein